MPALELNPKKSFIFWLTVAAAFFLIMRVGQPVKLADLLFVALGASILISSRARKLATGLWPRAKTYLLPLFFMFLFVILGQLFGFLIHGPAPIEIKEIVTNYGRLILEIIILMLLAALISVHSKLIRYVSIAVFVSPIVILPIFFGIWLDLLLDSGRLAGFLNSPIILGYWLIVIFLVGIGLFLSSKNTWQRMAILFGLVIIANFILWSASRAAWLSLIVALILWSAIYFRKKMLKKCLALATITFLVFYLGYLLFPAIKPIGGSIQSFVAARAVKFATNPPADQIRHQFWLKASRLVIQNPLGMGFGYYSKKDAQGGTLHPFNTYLEIAVYGGAGALIMFLLMLSRLGASIKLALRELSGVDADLELAWLMAVPAVLISIFFADSIFFRYVWFVLGVALGISWQEKNKSSHAIK